MWVAHACTPSQVSRFTVALSRTFSSSSATRAGKRTLLRRSRLRRSRPRRALPSWLLVFDDMLKTSHQIGDEILIKLALRRMERPGTLLGRTPLEHNIAESVAQDYAQWGAKDFLQLGRGERNQIIRNALSNPFIERKVPIAGPGGTRSFGIMGTAALENAPSSLRKRFHWAGSLPVETRLARRVAFRFPEVSKLVENALAKVRTPALRRIGLPQVLQWARVL